MQCPEPDRIAAYLDDTLFDEERRVLEEHFALCEDCWQIFSNAVDYISVRRAGEPAEGGSPPDEVPVKRAFWGRRRNWTTAVAALLALAVGGGWLRLGDGAGSRRAERAQLAAAAVDERPVVPRVAGEAWGRRPAGPYRSASAGIDPSRLPYLAPFVERLAQAKRLAEATPRAPQLRELGIAYLLVGSPDDALRELERAAAAAPGDAGVLRDIAAAYLARGLENEDANDLAQSLETVAEALTLEPQHPAARFNRALALEAMPLPVEAHRAWQAYLEVDPGETSQWAAEARDRARDLERRATPATSAERLRAQVVAATGTPQWLETLVAEHRQEAREAFVLDLLPAWARAVMAGGDDAAARLEAARRVAAVWHRQTGDRSLLRQVDDVANAGRRAASFARGHRALADGISAREQMRVEEARASFARAGEELPPESAAHAWAELELVATEFYRQGAAPALSQALEELVPRAAEDVPLGAHLSWLRGLLHFRRGEVAALGLFRDSLATFERLEETDHVAWLHQLLGNAYALFGDLPRAWWHRRQMLAAAPALTHLDRRFEMLLGPAIDAAYWEARPRLALVLLDELAAGSQSRSPRQAAELELWRSRIEMTLGRRGQARSRWLAAAGWLARVEDPTVRRRLGSELQAAAGLVAETPQRALAALSSSIDRARSSAPDFRLPELLWQRSRVYRELGEDARAAADLRAGVGWLLGQPAGGPVEMLWQERLRGGDVLFDDLIGLQVAAGDAAAALATLEQARARSLVSAAGTWEQQRPDGAAEDAGRPPAATQARLAPGTVVLSFCLLPEEALLWRLDAAGSTLIRLETRPRDLAAWARQLRTDLAAGAWTVRTQQAAALLYQKLIEPARLARRQQKVVVVPDGALDQLPFAALFDLRSGSFLVEQHTVQVAPSVAVFLAAQDRARQLRRPAPSILALGAPLADRDLFPELKPLRAAAVEVRDVAQLYSRRELLIGERATADAFLEKAGSHDVVHFAGHALTNTVDPARSSLVLTRPPDGNRSGALYAFEIPRARFASTRLVVLAGCGTGSGPPGADGGSLSLARAFLAARVPAVVASLWPVADGPTARLMSDLHRRIARGEDPAAALRAAQLAGLGAKDPALRSPSAWAAFGLLGG